jgi:hypothetical protein
MSSKVESAPVAAASQAAAAAATADAAFRAKHLTRSPGFRAWSDFLAVADDAPESKVVASAATRASALQLSHEALVAMFDRVDQDMQVWKQLLLATVYENEEEEAWQGSTAAAALLGGRNKKEWQRGVVGDANGGILAPVVEEGVEEEDMEDHTFLTGGGTLATSIVPSCERFL